MTGGFAADPERLGADADEFGVLAERAAGIVGALQAALGATPWGDDEVGDRFDAAHRPAAEHTLADLGGLAGGLTEMADAFSSAARAYRSAEDTAADAVTDAGASG